jgi:hypothetical protein
VSPDAPFAERQVRAAEDESARRGENERAEEPANASERTDYTCECTQDCVATVALTTQEYEDVRSVPTHFLAAPGHLVVGVEVVVLETPRYRIVEKFGAAAPVAARLDPREKTTHKRRVA